MACPFRDELPEFNVLEVMRQPLEDHTGTIVGTCMSLSFPHASRWPHHEPVPCGYFNDKSRQCQCTPRMIRRHIAKISGPQLDRVDIHLEVRSVQYKELRGPAGC